MHHIICSAAPNHQLIDSMINLIRHVTEPGEYSSPARTERTSPAKNTAAYPAVATTHTCAAASNHGSDCVELVSSPTGVRVGSARQFTTADDHRSQLHSAASRPRKNISAWKACVNKERKSPCRLLLVCCYISVLLLHLVFRSASFYCYVLTQ